MKSTARSKDPSPSRSFHDDGEKGALGKPTTTLREDVAAVGLDKVFERHGRIDLVPMPR